MVVFDVDKAGRTALNAALEGVVYMNFNGEVIVFDTPKGEDWNILYRGYCFWRNRYTPDNIRTISYNRLSNRKLFIQKIEKEICSMTNG